MRTRIVFALLMGAAACRQRVQAPVPSVPPSAPVALSAPEPNCNWLDATTPERTRHTSTFELDYAFALKNSLMSEACIAAHMMVVSATVDRDQKTFDKWRANEKRVCKEIR